MGVVRPSIGLPTCLREANFAKMTWVLADNSCNSASDCFPQKKLPKNQVIPLYINVNYLSSWQAFLYS